MTTANDIAKAVEPEDGWFHDPGTSDTIESAAQILLDEGISPTKARVVIEGIIYVIRNEYGE